MLKSRGEGSAPAFCKANRDCWRRFVARDCLASSPSAAVRRGRANRFARVVQTLKHEVLNGLCVVSERHLDHILRVGAVWYNHRRGHSGRDHLPPVRDEEDPPVLDLAKHKLVRRTELGGHLKSYRAVA